MPQLRRKGAVQPEIREEPQALAEIFVGPRVIMVTLPMPGIAEGDLDLVITRTSIRVRSRTDPNTPTFVVPLPVNVDPERYVLRHTNGLLDFTIERLSH